MYFMRVCAFCDGIAKNVCECLFHLLIFLSLVNSFKINRKKNKLIG